MENLALAQWTERGQALLDRARETLETAPSDKVQEIARRIPREAAPPDESVQVVFAGQYSAGKSSILKAMTGREDIEVGGDITTQQVQQLDWNGIRVADTPGVHTELRPDHDETTYGAISRADLLVFVVTNELFDSHMAEHFRKLAIEREKAHEMLLVVNKMQRCAEGNTPGAQEVIRQDLRRVLAPFTPEQLRLSFVDAEAAVEARTGQDEEVRRIYRQRSGFDAFIENLDAFVQEKGLAARYTTSLYTLEQALQEALAAETGDDPDADALQELLIQQRRALVEGKARLSQSVESKVRQTTSRIREEGRNAAELIHHEADSDAVNRELAAAQERVQEQVDALSGSVRETVEGHVRDLAARVDRIVESELVKELMPRLTERVRAIDIDPKTLSRTKQSADAARRLGQFLVEHSFNPADGASLLKLGHYSGTATHGVIKDVGHFFGKSFQPWEAVKWARAISNAGRVLSVAGVVLTVALQVKEDADAAKLERELRESRMAVRAGFGEAAHAIELHFDEATNTYVAETMDQRLAEVDEQLRELRDMRRSRSDLFQKLTDLLEDTRSLISEMHAS